MCIRARAIIFRQKIGVNDSLEYSEVPSNDNEEPSPFAVVDGKMTAAEGEPGSCFVNAEGELGYYDEKGNEVFVANGWGRNIPVMIIIKVLNSLKN